MTTCTTQASSVCPPKPTPACGHITIANAVDWPAPTMGESLIRLNPSNGHLYAWGEDEMWHTFEMGCCDDGGTPSQPPVEVTV